MQIANALALLGSITSVILIIMSIAKRGCSLDKSKAKVVAKHALAFTKPTRKYIRTLLVV